MKKLFLLLFLSVFIFSACDTTDGNLFSDIEFNSFDEAPYIIGKITDIHTRYIGEEAFLSVLVEENTDVYEPLKPGGNKISFFVSDSTEIFLQKKNGSIEDFPKNKLKKHQLVGGWSSGFIMDSSPAQGEAKRIVVIEK